MGNTSSSYLGSVGRGGTSNQTNASFQMGRARRAFQSQARELRRTAPGGPTFGTETRADLAGIQRSMEALQDYEDTPFGPALTREAAVGRLGGNRLMGNRAQPTLLDRAALRPSGSQMTAQQARTGGDRYIQMRFNEPNYRSR